MSVEYKCCDSVLHIIYKKSIPKYIEELADLYEGKIENRIGINFPMSIVSKYKGNITDIKKQTKDKDIKYIVVYKKGDKLTKDHELMHAKYHMDESHKEKVREIWDNMEESSRKRVISMLKKMGYPDNNMDILVDEFQAYYYTEKKNFFGKNL